MLSVEPFRIKQGDRRPYLYATLGPLDEDGEVPEGGGQDLAGATVTFNMRKDNPEKTVVITGGACVVDDADQGHVHYPWQVGDTDLPGTFFGEFQADYGGEPATFPNNKVGFKIVITPQIA